MLIHSISEFNRYIFIYMFEILFVEFTCQLHSLNELIIHTYNVQYMYNIYVCVCMYIIFIYHSTNEFNKRIFIYIYIYIFQNGTSSPIHKIHSSIFASLLIVVQNYSQASQSFTDNNEKKLSTLIEAQKRET